MEQAKELQIDQNQCRHLKGYYGFDRPKSVAEPAVLTESQPSFWQRSGSDERPAPWPSLDHAHP
jgi:hypothetical protein